MGIFHLWIYYGLLIGSRPGIAWNPSAVVINFLGVAAYRHFSRLKRPGRKADTVRPANFYLCGTWWPEGKVCLSIMAIRAQHRRERRLKNHAGMI